MNQKIEDIRSKFKNLTSSKSEVEAIKRDSHILMWSFLSEIERLYRHNGLNRKELAEKIDISESYLSQVFNGVKPLNFLTLAKIKRVLKIRFRVTGEFIPEKRTSPEFSITQFLSNVEHIQTGTATPGGGHAITDDYREFTPFISQPISEKLT